MSKKKKKKSDKNQCVDDQECVRLNQLVDIAYHLSQWIFSPKERREIRRRRKNTD